MTAMPKIVEITVAVATLDRPEALARCLDAMLAGDLLPRELLVVDQSAGDAARAVVEAIDRRGVEVRYIRQPRLGLSASRNAAVARATSPLVAVTDDDCVPSASWLATIARDFASGDAPDVVTGRVLPLGPDVPGLYAVSTRESTTRAIRTGRVEPWHVGTGGNLAFRREWVDRAGGYDERLGAGSPGEAGEDMDLFYRLTTAGARVLFDPESVVYHERKSWATLVARQRCYGRGIGAFATIWTRRRHAYPLYILALWLGHHAKRLTRAAAGRRWDVIRETISTLRGTAGGVVYGLRVRERAAEARGSLARLDEVTE